jgi:hypothetical protein
MRARVPARLDRPVILAGVSYELSPSRSPDGGALSTPVFFDEIKKQLLIAFDGLTPPENAELQVIDEELNFDTHARQRA